MNNKRKILNQVRIIGGEWRGRKITFPDGEQLRPTPDRVRETLFNWLASVVHDAVCLDLFAGSGALGLEALSRGAKSVAFVDSSRAVCEAIKDHLKVLKQDACVHQQDAFSFLEATQKSFDIIFLDPPFHQNLITPISEKIAEKQLLKPEGYLYIEKEKQADFKLPPDFKLLKEKIAGQVTYSLAQFANE